MSYHSPYASFVFERYAYNPDTGVVEFEYSFDHALKFTEKVRLQPSDNYDKQTFDSALLLAFIIAGTSYYKTFPTKVFQLAEGIDLDRKQADVFNAVYRDGLSQFVYENNLSPEDIAAFTPTTSNSQRSGDYSGNGAFALQSGGKDSLLLAELLSRNNVEFTPWFISQNDAIPAVLESLDPRTVHPLREVDIDQLRTAQKKGALNGHVPVTYILMSYALLSGILHGKETILAAIGHEGEEPHAYIGDYAVTHQWSKTWRAEQMLRDYVHDYVADDLRVGSPLRSLSEIKIAQMFVAYCWEKYRTSFSSCNTANYKLGHDNSRLVWCGNCSKCANSFILFAAFVDPADLQEIFGGNLFLNKNIEQDFKGLLGIDGAVKPFECVAEVDELRKAYELALARGYEPLPFSVDPSSYDIDTDYPSQQWASELIGLR